MKAEPAPAADGAALRLLVDREQVRLAVEQLRRIPIPHLLQDACLAWTAYSAGLGSIAWAWLAAMTICQVGRSVWLVRLHAKGHVAPARMRRLLASSLMLLGTLNALQVVLVFLQPPGTAQYILTMILIGTAAGAVSSVAGDLRAYLPWSVVYGGALVLSWVSLGTLEAAAIGGLILFLFAILCLTVRDQGRTLEQLVSLSESLRAERDRAERASEAKTRFFAAASHDLRQPLTALSYNAATVQALASMGGDETLARVSEGIGRALQESRSLVDSLLEVSELDAGVVQAQRSSVDVRELLAGVHETFAPLARERGLLLAIDDAAAPARVPQALTDAALLRRILQNLVANAIKFTQSGSVRLGLAVDPAAGVLAIRVQDTGPGIPAEAQERVFEEFFQIGNLERNRSHGLGLGLAIVRRLARLIDAEVRLHSAPGQGCTFEVRVPCAQAPALAPAAPPLRPQQLAAARAGHAPGRTRVLVVDDEPQVRRALQTLLATMGWQVAAAVDEAEALRLWDEGFQPDALIVDFRLQDGASGLDVLMALRRRGCNAPAWMVTGDTEPARILAARAAGVPVIYKPVDGLQLVRTLQAALAPGEAAAQAS